MKPKGDQNERFRRYAIENMLDAVKRMERFDRIGNNARGYDVVALEARWRHNHLDNASKWAMIALALKGEPEVET